MTTGPDIVFALPVKRPIVMRENAHYAGTSAHVTGVVHRPIFAAVLLRGLGAALGFYLPARGLTLYIRCPGRYCLAVVYLEIFAGLVPLVPPSGRTS